jgi:hypothetical protein
LAFVLVVGNGEDFQRGAQIVRHKARSWIVGDTETVPQLAQNRNFTH